ncbi:MAG: hypothetical protein HUJ31_01935, partial [Pseudomonadales bacterium]|nr:hypothetical protein [Pseudomonadales bacterium]
MPRKRRNRRNSARDDREGVVVEDSVRATEAVADDSELEGEVVVETSVAGRPGKKARSYDRDLTQGSIIANLWHLSWPITISRSIRMLGPTQLIPLVGHTMRM